MRLRTLGAVCATSAAAVPLTLAPSTLAQQPATPAAASPPAVRLPGDMRSAAMALHAGRHVYFARRYHRLLGDPLSLGERRTLYHDVIHLQPARLRARTRDLRGDIRRLRARLERRLRGAAPSVAIPPQLQAIARCESGGDPRAVSSGGTYRGKYQFSSQTWAAVGGSGDPAAAPEDEQDRRAAMLYRRAGPGQWPVCGR
jgi:hypothetical protein